MPNTKIARVPHLWGIDAAYQMPQPHDPSKPTMVLVNSFGTSSELFRPQFRDRKITDTMNLLAIEPLGHGQTQALKTESFTYWDTAIMNLQVMDELGIEQAFAMGTSQGGLIVARMALLRPDRVRPLSSLILLLLLRPLTFSCPLTGSEVARSGIILLSTSETRSKVSCH